MRDEEFCSGLDQWGGDLAAWPASKREDARALLENSAQARAALSAMQTVESLLAQPPAAVFDSSAIAARATAHAQARLWAMSPALRRISFAALGIAALAAGILVGITPSSTAVVGSVQTALNGGGSDVW